MSNLLRSHVQTEGFRHQWGLEFSADSGIPLLLTWDQFPGSQPSESGRMLSRVPRERLDTSKARKTFLAVHADHKNGNLLRSHSRSHRQSYKIMPNGESGKEAVNDYGVNPNARMKNGFSIRNMDAEMRYYGIPDPYGKLNKYYRNHCICLWEVTEEEVVGYWEWDDLLKTDCWYKQVTLPAFKRHNEKYDACSGALNMSVLWVA